MVYGHLEYRGYVGVFEFHEVTNRFFGKVFYLNPELTFGGDSLESTKENFRVAIEKYIAWSKKKGYKELANDNCKIVRVTMKTI